MAPYLKGELERILWRLEYGCTEDDFQLLRRCPWCGKETRICTLESSGKEIDPVLLSRLKLDPKSVKVAIPTCKCFEELSALLERGNALELLTVFNRKFPELCRALEDELKLKIRNDSAISEELDGPDIPF